MYRDCDSHRFFIARSLFEGSLRGIGREQPMLDVLMLAIGLAFFVLSIGYAFACDRL
jgi:hypothetical protein